MTYSSDLRLNEWRQSGELVRVIRDSNEINDVIGRVVAWDEDIVLIRKFNKRMVKVKRDYRIEPFTALRPEFELPPLDEEL